MFKEQAALGAPVTPTEVIPPNTGSLIVSRDRSMRDTFWGSTGRRVATVALSAATLAGIGYVGSEAFGGGGAGLDGGVAAAASGSLPSGVTNYENCEDSKVTYSTFPGHPSQIVPGTEKVGSSDQAGNYNRSLFNVGNQGRNIDPAATATFYALMGYPATNSATDNESNVHDIFEQAFNQIESGANVTNKNGREVNKAAVNFCDINESVTSQTFGYDPSAIDENVAYTQISAKVGSDGHIDDIALKQVTNHSDTIGGVTYKLQNGNTDANFSGFNEVIIPTNGHGTIDVLGILPNAGTNNQQVNQGPTGNTQQNQGPTGTNPNKNNPSSSSTNSNKNTGPQNSTTNKGGSSPTETSIPTGGAGVSSEGTGSGQSGTGTGNGSGNGGGNSGNTGGTTSTTVGNRPPTPTTTPTTEAAPPPPTTTVPPTTVPTTTPTTQPSTNKIPEPGCDPNIDPSCD